MIYLDNSATTRPSVAAAQAAKEMFENFGNPSSLHHVGVAAQRVTDGARKAVAKAIDAREDEIFFTSGGTEANNTALIGGAFARRKRGDTIVITAVEHDSVMASAKFLEEQGFRVIKVTPAADGTLTAEDFEKVIDSRTILVSCMLVNNETGAIFPVEKLRGIVRRVNAPALIHVDAVQALGKMRVSAEDMGCDMLTVSAHKIHGLKGSGALFIKKGTTLRPFILGGHQEKGFRAGTEATPAIAAFGAACGELDHVKEAKHLREVKQAFLDRLAHIPQVRVNSPEKSAPHIINFSVPGYRSETLLHAFESRDIYVSSGSACKKGEISHVLKAQGLPREITDSAVRVSLSKDNTVAQADVFAQALDEIIATVAHVKV